MGADLGVNGTPDGKSTYLLTHSLTCLGLIKRRLGIVTNTGYYKQLYVTLYLKDSVKSRLTLLVTLCNGQLVVNNSSMMHGPCTFVSSSKVYIILNVHDTLPLSDSPR